MRFLIFAFLAYLLYRFLRIFLASGQETRQRENNNGIIDEMVQDPMCKTYIPLRDARRKIIAGEEHFFCSQECADRFQLEWKSKQ